MDETILAYIAGFLDGDGSIFFQIIPNKDKSKFQIRTSIAFYQKKEYAEILEWLKETFGGIGYIRHRKTGMSDYTIVESKEVQKILEFLQPYSKLKKKQIELGLEILDKLENKKSEQDFLDICKLVDKFKDLNYSKKRTITSDMVSKSIPL